MTNRSMKHCDVIGTVLSPSQRVLNSYRFELGAVRGHANSRRRTHEGGYGSRQLNELIQNGADEMCGQDSEGRLNVALKDRCAVQVQVWQQRKAESAFGEVSK